MSRRRIHQEQPDPAPTQEEAKTAKKRQNNIIKIKDDVNDNIREAKRLKETDRKAYLNLLPTKKFTNWIKTEILAAKNNLTVTNKKLRDQIKSMTDPETEKHNKSIMPDLPSFGTPDQSNQTSQKNKEPEKVPYLGDIGKLTPDKLISPKKDRSRNRERDERDPTI